MEEVNVCPKCGFNSDSGFTECPKCGVIVVKFLENERRKDELPVQPVVSEDQIYTHEKTSSRNKIIVISGIGAKDYYRNIGYKKKGPYMAKDIKT